MLLLLFTIHSCGPSRAEIEKREKSKADSLAVIQHQREDSIKQAAIEEGKRKAEEEQKKKEEEQAMKDEVYRMNNTIHDADIMLPTFKAELEVAKSNLTEAKKVRLLVTNAERERNIRNASLKISQIEQRIATIQLERQNAVKRKAELEKIVGKIDYSEMEFD